jgi:hypothetical protein
MNHEEETVPQENGLALHDGRFLPSTPDLRRTLRLGLDSVLSEGYAARGGQEVKKPEDAYPLLRALGALSETMRDYGRAFTEAAREVEARAGDDLIEMYGEQDGIPNGNATVPDTDGTELKVSVDYMNEYSFDVNALISASIMETLASAYVRERAGMMFQAEFNGDGAESTRLLAELLAEGVDRVLALGKFQPQVTKTRALAKTLSTQGADGVASTITDATTKTVKNKGIKIVREQPKEK